MDDLTITRLCAEASEISIIAWDEKSVTIEDSGEIYNPLHDDAQAMALMKKFEIETVYPSDKRDGVHVTIWISGKPLHASSVRDNLNRAICLCIANMQQAIAGEGK